MSGVYEGRDTRARTYCRYLFTTPLDESTGTSSHLIVAKIFRVYVNGFIESVITSPQMFLRG